MIVNKNLKRKTFTVAVGCCSIWDRGVPTIVYGMYVVGDLIYTLRIRGEKGGF
jgi:hypothetical protein